MRVFKYLFLYFCVVFIIQNGVGQVIDNSVVINPSFNTSPGTGQTIGGATVALPDSIPVIINNPANLGHLRSLKALVSMNFSGVYIDPASATENDFNNQQSNYGINVGTCAVSVPFSLFHLPWTLAASYHGKAPYDYNLGNSSILYNISGQSHMASVGIAIRQSSKFSIGIGWTHWFGKYKWINHDLLNYQMWSENTSYYSGNLYYIGLQNDIAEHFAFGLVFYLPYRLSVESNTTYSDNAEYKVKQQQEYSGTLRIGLGYRFNPDWTMGLGYGYQWNQDDDRGISSISGGIEYKLKINTISIPLYLKYESRFLPEELVYYPFSHSEESVTCHIVGFGGGIQLKNFTYYFSSQWRHCGNYLKTMYIPAPPYS